MRLLPSLMTCLVLLGITGCGARTILREPREDGGVPVGDVPVGDVPFTPDGFIDDNPFIPDRFIVDDFPAFPDRSPVFDIPILPDAFPPRDIPFPPPDVELPGQTCGRPIELMAPGVFRGQSTAAAVDALGPCGMAPPTHGIYYAVTVPAGQTLHITTRPDTTDNIAIPEVLSDCAGRMCVGAPFPVDEATRTVGTDFTNGARTPQRVLFAVGGFPDGAPVGYTLALTLEGSTVNATCDRARVVTAPTMFTADTSTSTQTAPRCSSTVPSGGPALWYRTTVPAGQRIEVRASTPGSTGAGVVQLYTACGTAACLAQAIDSAATGAQWTNTDASPRDVVYSVASRVTGRTASFAVVVTLTGAAGNTRCGMPTVLTPGVPVTGQDLLAMGDTPTPCVGEPTPAMGSLWYRVRVPSGQNLNVQATTAVPSRGVQMRLLRTCGGACSAFSPFSTDGRTSTLRWTNTGPDLDVLIAASGSGGIPGTYDIVATLSTPPTNVTCSRATAVTDGTVLRGEDLSFASETQAVCPGMMGSPTPSLFYTTTIPAGQTLVVSATPTNPSAQPVIRVVPSCGSSVCLAATTGFGGSSAALTYNNTATAPQRVIIAVGSQSGVASTFDLAVRIRAPATNGRCATPTRVTDGTVLRGENLTDAIELPTACPLPGRDAGALYYTARVPAGERVSATAVPVGGFAQVRVRVFERCGATACLAASPEFGGGTATAATYTNSTAAAQDVIIAVNSIAGMGSATQVDMTFHVGRPPYTTTTIAASCDDMSGATAASSLTGDDVGEGSRALPFPFVYFGEAERAWAGSTNGYLQLFPSSGMSVGALGGTEVPSPSAPLGMIAAFWDDLFFPVPASVRYRDVASPRHLTVEWPDVQFCCGGAGPDRMTFQVKLFATTNVIELHYCSMTGTPRVNGSAAIVGIQDSTGTLGVSFAARRADAVRTGLGVRFTP